MPPKLMKTTMLGARRTATRDGIIQSVIFLRTKDGNLAASPIKYHHEVDKVKTRTQIKKRIAEGFTQELCWVVELEESNNFFIQVYYEREGIVEERRAKITKLPKGRFEVGEWFEPKTPQPERFLQPKLEDLQKP